MVEFDFDLKPLFAEEIIKISPRDLSITNFRADPQCWHKLSRLQTVIDRMGKLSAEAQELKVPITTAEKLKYSDNTTLYLMAKLNGKGKDSVVGLLKVGKKDLFLYDEMKQQRQVSQVPCILDFYVYETCQRSGYGKKLFENMLKEEKWKPNKCSIDRPSDKLKGFLKKHYGLEQTIPQGYKFVLYKGFFDEQCENRNNELPSTSKNSYQKAQFIPSRVKHTENHSRQATISLEHFGADLDVFEYNNGCNQKISRHYLTERPYNMVEMMQTVNKRF